MQSSFLPVSRVSGALAEFNKWQNKVLFIFHQEIPPRCLTAIKLLFIRTTFDSCGPLEFHHTLTFSIFSSAVIAIHTLSSMKLLTSLEK